MILRMEVVKRYKENEYSVECNKGLVSMADTNIIGNLCDTIEAQHEALIKAKEALRIIEFINNDGHDNGICPYCRHDEHESFCYVGNALTAIEKVIV